MLERVPAAAESTAHFFIRSVENPVRSSRVLDPRFWRNGADDLESSTWWPSYLQRIRTVHQTRPYVYEDHSATSYSSSTRLAKSSILRQRCEPTPFPAVAIQAQQKGTTLRSYSVSAPNNQLPNPRVAESLVDTDTTEHLEASNKSHNILKEQDNLRRKPNEERALRGKILQAKAKRWSLHSGSPVGKKASTEKARSMRHGPENFDLTLDAATDWLSGDSVGLKANHIKKQSGSLKIASGTSSHSYTLLGSSRDSGCGDVKSSTEGDSVTRNKDQNSDEQTLHRGVYQSFDLESLHNSTSQSYDGSFDLDAVLRQERASGTESLERSIESKNAPSSLSISAELRSDNPMLHTEPDLYTGWTNSNSFAALVPEESSSIDTAIQEPLPPSSEYPHEKNEGSFKLDEQQAETTARYGRKMAASLEAHSPPTWPLGTDSRDQRKSSLSSKSRKEVPESQQQTPKKVRFDALLQLRTAATTEQFDEAWTLFLSFDNQEVLAPYIFRFLTYSSDDKHLPRALAAFNTIPRSRRTEAMYQAAVGVELKRHQHGSAMNLAFEASIRGFDALPGFLAYLVKNLLWNSAAELLHRNKFARQDFAQFAPVPETSASAQKRMLSIPELLVDCDKIHDLHAKVLSLAARVQSQDSAFVEHIGLLKVLCQRLTIQTVQNPNVIAEITPQALIGILDLEKLFGHLGLHYKALDTIFQLPNPSDKLDIALLVYRNFRFKYPGQIPNPRIIRRLISLCGDADQPSTQLYDYLLDQLERRPDATVYHEIMTHFSRRGDVQAVSKYLNLLTQHHGKPSRAALINPMIHVYAVKGDTSNARERLNQMGTRYNLVADTVSWNMLMLAHVRSDDDISAFDVQEEMRRKKIKFNQYTYGQLLAVCAAHGDTEAALDVLVDARDDFVQISVPMINTVVETYLRNDNSNAALRFAMTAMESEDKGALTRLWNSFIRYFAFKGRLNDLMKTRDIMARYNIASDGMTYAPIMTLLTSMRQTSEAMNLLRRMHQEEKIPVTMFHYSIILHGFVAEDNRNMTALVFREMKQKFPDINDDANAAMMILQARRAAFDHAQESEQGTAHGVNVLAELLGNSSRAESFPFDLVSTRSPKNGAAVSMYFETIIRALIRSRSYDSAARLMKYVDVSLDAHSKDRNARSSPPKGMTLAQLDIAMEREDWAEFDKVWKDTFQKALKSSGSIPTTRKGREIEGGRSSPAATVSPHLKYSLSSYLNRYMEAMARQFRQGEMKTFFRRELSHSGFVFTGRNWNKYIQVLCRSNKSRHRIQAFKVFEKSMRTKAQSWNLLTRGKMWKKTTSYLWQPYGQRNRPILQKENTFRIVKRSDEMRFHPERKVPTYLTAVHLGAVLVGAHLQVQRGLPRQFDTIRRMAPRTKRFIQYMPRLKDGIQGAILRQLGHRENQRPRPRSEQSFEAKTDLDGVIGDRSPLNHIPFDLLDDIEEITGRSNAVRNLLKDSPTDRGRSHQGRTDVEIGEMFTGQISRGPIVLAGKGRMETPVELEKRIGREERQKKETVERLREDLRLRQVTGDVHRPPLQVGAHVDRTEDQESLRPSSAMGSLPPIFSGDEVRTNDESTPGPSPGQLFGSVPVQQELDALADKREQRNREAEEARSRTRPIPQLAIPFMDQRRLRRRLALGQRRQARQLLEELKDRLSPRAYEARTAAARRLEAFERAQRRRKAVLAYERDLRAGKRLDPFPKTIRGLERSRFVHGRVRVRFTPDLGRKRKNYLVRRGVLHDRRQRQVQTVASKGVSYVTRYDRIGEWLEARYGPQPAVSHDVEENEAAEESEEVAEDGENVYRPFSK